MMVVMSDVFEAHIVAAVRAEVARQGRKLGDLAAPLGLSYPTVSNRLNGYSSFTLDELRKIATFLGMTTGDLMESANFGSRIASGVHSKDDEALQSKPDPWEQPRGSRRRRKSHE
ncbi:helix-turn-helix domain-containing protein [Microbacterium oryzae]|nr:helix-turn-helix transcriptional regulator [Microbacterium oryzae]